MSEFITRVGGDEYQVIFKTDSVEKYHAVEDFCREIIDHDKPSGWISVKDRLPEEHPSVFANYYGTEKWNKAMWRKESDRVLVAIRFPDGTRTVDKGKLQDGVWKTGVSPVLPQEVTHWAMWPEPPKGEP